MRLFIFLLTLPTISFATSQEELDLLNRCKGLEVVACEKLGAYYLSQKNWENAQAIGEALCKKEVFIGCTYAGTSLLAQNKLKDGIRFLNQSCDEFEPYACRSLGRLFKSENALLSHLYFRRACQYGLDEICRDLSKKKELFTKMGESYLRLVKQDCSSVSEEQCQSRLKQIPLCPAPLTKDDCLVMPGYLSVYFRAKVQQLQAKLMLNSFLAEEKKLSSFSRDLSTVIKEFKEENPQYVLGFKNACSSARKNSTLELFSEKYKNASGLFKSAVRKFFLDGKKSECSVSGFEAFAVGNLDRVHPDKLDIWKIDQDGNLLQVKDGLP